MQREKFLLLVNLISIPVGTAHLGALFYVFSRVQFPRTWRTEEMEGG